MLSARSPHGRCLAEAVDTTERTVARQLLQRQSRQRLAVPMIGELWLTASRHAPRPAFHCRPRCSWGDSNGYFLCRNPKTGD